MTPTHFVDKDDKERMDTRKEEKKIQSDKTLYLKYIRTIVHLKLE